MRHLVILGGLIAAVPTVALAAQEISTGATYPREALRKHHEGRVIVEVRVGIDGRVHACTVTKSSGYRELDQATCDLMQTRARFDPAKDSAGRPVEDTYTQSIDWRLPQ